MERQTYGGCKKLSFLDGRRIERERWRGGRKEGAAELFDFDELNFPFLLLFCCLSFTPNSLGFFG